MNKATKTTIGVLAVAGGAQHVLNGLFSFDLVGKVTSMLPSWGATTVFVVAGVAGIMAGWSYLNK